MLTLICNEFQDSAMSGSWGGGVCEFKKHRINNVQSGELVKRRWRHNNFTTVLQVVSFISRQHWHREAPRQIMKKILIHKPTKKNYCPLQLYKQDRKNLQSLRQQMQKKSLQIYFRLPNKRICSAINHECWLVNFWENQAIAVFFALIRESLPRI